MRYGLRRLLPRIGRLAAASGVLLAVVGCGDEPVKKDESAGGIPSVLKKSNDQMENFMKSKSAAKKN
jgi:hypothetical protein